VFTTYEQKNMSIYLSIFFCLSCLDRTTVRGNLLSDDTSVLPYGSQIIVSIVDVSLQDVPSRPLNTFLLYGSYRFPIAFEIPYSINQIQSINNFQRYAIQARIEKDGQLLYINDQYTPVKLNPASVNPVNVYMKKIATSIIPGEQIFFDLFFCFEQN